MATKKRQVVFVVLYGHKHGTDCWVSSTESLAWSSIRNTIRHYMDDLTTEQSKKVTKLLRARKTVAAMNLWGEFTEEWFEVNPRTVDT